jgi:hypothetical protein
MLDEAIGKLWSLRRGATPGPQIAAGDADAYTPSDRHAWKDQRPGLR